MATKARVRHANEPVGLPVHEMPVNALGEIVNGPAEWNGRVLKRSLNDRYEFLGGALCSLTDGGTCGIRVRLLVPGDVIEITEE